MKLNIQRFAGSSIYLKLYKNDGTDTYKTEELGSSSQSLPLGIFTRDGYNFVEWNSKADGTGNSIPDGASYDEINGRAEYDEDYFYQLLYAQWEPAIITITLDNNDATITGSTSATVTSFDNNLSAITNPQKTGYDFLGWFTTATSNDMVIDTNGNLVANVDGYTNSDGNWIKGSNTTLYAQWETHFEAETILTNKQHYHNIADAIRTRNGTTNPYLPSEMATAVRNIKVESNIINSAIDSYLAKSETIDADTFVEFVNDESMPIGTDTTLVEISPCDNVANAVRLDDSRVFLTINGKLPYSHLCGVICTINNGIITPGEITTLNTELGSYLYASAVKLTKDKVFIAHCNNNADAYLNGIICTIDGTTIIPGTDTTLVDDDIWCGYYASVVKIDAQRVFIAHNSGKGDISLNGIICTIDGTTITPGTDTTLGGNSSYHTSAILLNSHHILVSGDGGIVVECFIDGTTIKPLESTYIQGVTEGAKLFPLSDYSAFALYAGRKGILYSCIINSGSSLTVNAATELEGSISYAKVVKISNNKVMVLCRNGINLFFEYQICTISRDTITAEDPNTIVASSYASYYIDATLLEDGIVFAMHAISSSSWNGVLIGKKYVKLPETKIDGITKSECTTSTAGEVWKVEYPLSFSTFGYLERTYVYYFDDGMTWGEWCNSIYNTDGYEIKLIDGKYAVARDNRDVYETRRDTQSEVENLEITENYSYGM